MAKKKTVLGIEQKPVEQLDQEYSNLAAKVGHMTMLAGNTLKQVDKARKDIETHLGEMNDLANRIVKIRGEMGTANSEASQLVKASQ